MGDIPKEAVIGAYTDEEVKRMGFKVGESLDEDSEGRRISEDTYYADLYEMGYTYWGSHWIRED